MPEALKSMSDRRHQIFEHLGLLPYLQQRRTLKLTEQPLHCEYYLHSEDAPWILFIPGIGTYSELYCEMLAKLSRQGFNTISVDLPGHGYSGGPRGDYRLEQLVRQLGQVIDHIEQLSQAPIGVFGCSIGARIGLALAEHDPRVKALMCHTLFINELAPDFFHSMGWQALSISSWMMPYAEVDFRTFIDLDNLLSHNPMGEFARQDSKLVWRYPITTLDSVYSASSQVLLYPIQTPSAIIVGEHDEILPPSYIRRLVERCEHRFELFEVAGGQHMLPFDQIDQTVEIVSGWFAKTFEQHTAG